MRGISCSGLCSWIRLRSLSGFVLCVWFDTWRSLVVPREQNDGSFASEGTIIDVVLRD